jgi:hypothetical protein
MTGIGIWGGGASEASNCGGYLGICKDRKASNDSKSKEGFVNY